MTRTQNTLSKIFIILSFSLTIFSCKKDEIEVVEEIQEVPLNLHLGKWAFAENLGLQITDSVIDTTYHNYPGKIWRGVFGQSSSSMNLELTSDNRFILESVEMQIDAQTNDTLDYSYSTEEMYSIEGDSLFGGTFSIKAFKITVTTDSLILFSSSKWGNNDSQRRFSFFRE
jgi:hypothetical protein